MKDLQEFFDKMRIKPHNKEIYEMAFTHSSFNSDAKTHHHDYQRLEFIGDSVLGFVVAGLIFKFHPEMDEGKMTKTKATLVQTSYLAKKAIDNDYLSYIRYGHSLNAESIVKNEHILEDIFEAVIGAVYVDQGTIFAVNFVRRFFEKDIKKFIYEDVKDYKSRLQEAMQAEYRESVVYDVISEKGPPHDRTFEIIVSFNGQTLGRGVGKSKKAAEQEAAKDALSKVVS